MAQLSIRVDELAADDWVVREEGGREFGHYPTQREAEDVGRLVARKRKAVLLVNGRAGKEGEPTDGSRGSSADSLDARRSGVQLPRERRGRA